MAQDVAICLTICLANKDLVLRSVVCFRLFQILVKSHFFIDNAALGTAQIARIWRDISSKEATPGSR